MADRDDVVNLDVERTERVSATFADGHVASFRLDELRLACPCATCRDLRDREETVWTPSPTLPLAIADARLHGAWGLNITWNDGHSTGIYPFEALRRWSERPDRGAAG